MNEGKLPSMVYLFGIPYTVTPVAARSDVGSERSESLAGQIDYHRCEIRICTQGPWELQFQTLIHELLHGLVTELQLRESIKEEQVTLLAAGLTELLLTNQELVKEILHG